jgi:alpha-methylacyl-CoA racemase
MDEARDHPHNTARSAFIDIGGMSQPAPAPRFGTTKLGVPAAPGTVDPRETLLAWGFSREELAALPI